MFLRNIYFVSDLISLFYIIIKNLIYRKTRYVISSENDERRIIIMGNGPSLRQDLDNIITQRDDCKLYAVNNFPLTKEFSKLKPDVYVFSDPMYWSDRVNSKLELENELLYQSLNAVDWPLTIVCPSHGSTFVELQVHNNKKIKLEPVTSTYLQLHSEKLTIWALKNRVITPNFVDVSILAIWHALQQSTQKIDLYGLDGTSFKELDVDQNTNRVMKRGAHFYNNNSANLAELDKYPEQKPKKLYERFYQIWLKFINLHYLSILATVWNKKIRNLSSYSFLDNFDRK